MSFLNIGQKIEKVIGKEMELLEAARTGNLQTVERILSSKGKKSHHVGGAIGQKLSSFLKSVNVNHKDKNGYTALHHASVNGHRDVVEALLKADAQPGLIDQQGCTPVQLAAWNGDAEIVMQLLTAGTDSEVVSPVNVNHQNLTGDTALHCGAQYGNVAVVDVLLQKSANPTIRNLNEASPLDLAAQYGRLEVVQRLLISHPELARHPSSTQSPLHLASRNGHREIAAVLLDHNFDIQTMTETGNALHEAALHGKLDVVKFLLERGIDVNQRDNKGQTVLELLSAHQAQQKSFTEITRAIQEHMRDSGSLPADPGLYESLASCRSGGDKPTAAVKPLPPEKPHSSDKPLPPDKPHPLDTEKPEETTPDRLVPTPRLSVYHISSDSEPERISQTPLYSKPKKEKAELDRVISTSSSITDQSPPPLPPRTSVFSLDDRHSSVPAESSVPSIPETGQPVAKACMSKPKKPPRQKRSPAPVRKSPPIVSDLVDDTTDKPNNNIPEQNVSIPTTQAVHNDSADCESSSTHSLQCTDQLHCAASGGDQPDCSISHSTQSCATVQIPRLSRKEDNSSEPQTGRSVSEGFYMEMSSVNKTSQTIRPVSEVKPQVKDSNSSTNEQIQLPSQQGVDNYGILFPNLRKLSADLSRKPELRRMNTAPNPEEDVYVKPFPTSPTEKFKEKQGLLRRSNTAPEESTYMLMNNPTQGNEQKDGTMKEHEYAEIPEKDGSLSPVSPIENIYATIAETGQDVQGTKLEVETNVYLQIKDLSPVPSPRDSGETKVENGDTAKTKEENKQSDETTAKAIEENGKSEETLEEKRKTKNNAEEESKQDKASSGKTEEKKKDTVDVKEENKSIEESKEENVNKGSPKPTHLDFLKNKPDTPLTPTGYPQPPTPDFPPPSPATAMLGIEMKIQQIDSKRKSRDITTITDDTFECIREQRSEVKTVDETSEVRLTKKSSEVKVTADCKSISTEASESKRNELLGENQTPGNTDSKVTQTTNLINEKDSNTKTDHSDESISVIVSHTKSIPESSIPHTVIETEADKMSRNKPPVPKKPDMKSRSFKGKEPEDVTKTSTTLVGGSAKVKVTDQKDTKNSTDRAGDSASVKVTEKDTKYSTDGAGDSASVKVTKKDTKNSTDGAGDSASVKVRDKKEIKDNTSEGGDSASIKVTVQEKDAKNGNAEGAESPVRLRRKTSTPDMDVFKGLLRGSTIGTPFKERSKFYDEVIRKSQARLPVPKSLKPAMEKEEDIDIDQVMESIDVEVAKRVSASDPTSFDDSEEWEKIQDIMESFGGGIARESVFVRDLQPAFTKLLAGSGQMISIGEWLESVNMGQYENNFVANGYDNIDYLDSNILEEQDLEQIGVLSHEHRQKILQATKSLPLLKPIDADDLPPSVEEWLMSLQLPDYLETFTSHGYDTMEKVQSILWELQLRTVLDISTLGHRKRILASLGERKPLDRHTQKKRSLSSLSPEDRSPFNNIDLFKDYTNVKPVSSSEEDIKESSQMAVDSSEDDDVFRQKKTGQSIRNADIHVRPPHMAQTSSPAKQWRHKPEMLIKGCCNYTAQYLGSTVVPELTAGTESTRAGITKLKLRFLHQLQKSADILGKIPVIMLSISYKGVKFIDAKSKKVICDHEIGNIFCACQDTDNLNFFAYITRDIETGQHYCHVFSVKSASLAHDIILTLGESFEVAYQMALKEKSNEEAMELDQKMSQSDAEDSYSTISKLSTNTV